MTKTETRLARAAEGHGKAYCSLKSIMGTETIDSGATRDQTPDSFQRSVVRVSAIQGNNRCSFSFGSLRCTSFSLTVAERVTPARPRTF